MVTAILRLTLPPGSPHRQIVDLQVSTSHQDVGRNVLVLEAQALAALAASLDGPIAFRLDLPKFEPL